MGKKKFLEKLVFVKWKDSYELILDGKIFQSIQLHYWK